MTAKEKQTCAICGTLIPGHSKLDPLWDPLRKDSRFEKLLAELAPAE
jgi:hypothetical protein